jgi:lipopolysaccharide transport protein LptA
MTSSGGRRWRPTRRLQLAAAVVLILITSVLLFFILRSRPGRTSEEPARNFAPEKKIDEKVRIRYVEFRGDKEKVEFTADRTFIGADDLYHMVGNVQIIDHGRKGGQKIVLSGEEVVHDAERNRYVFPGPIQILYRDAIIRTSHLIYNRQAETFRTDRRVEINSPQFRGQALGLAYDLKTGRLVLNGDLIFEISAAKAGPPLVIQGETLIYHQGDRRGSIQGGIRLTHGRSWGTCREADFSLFANSDKLNIVYLRGGARLSLRHEFGTDQAASGPPAFLRLGDDQDIQADEIKLRAFLDQSLLHSYESKGACSVQFISSEGRRTRFQAEAIDFIFDQWGGLREFRSFTRARITQEGTDPGQTRTVEGDSAVLQGGSDWLQVRVKPGRKARAGLGETEIMAEELDFSLENNDLEGRAAQVVLAGRGGQSPGVFFEKDQPVFVTAGEVRYNSQEERFDFLDNVHMWQNRKMLLASQLAFWQASGKATGEGGVRASFPHQPKTRQVEEKIEISARRLDSLPEENKMIFKDEGHLHLEKAEVRADTIQIHLKPDTKEMEQMTAQGGVVVIHNAREGRGQQAVYEIEEDQIILTGNPLLLDKDKGQIEGRKLTFHLGDGTIAVENKGRERSLTLIKSNREQ